MSIKKFYFTRDFKKDLNKFSAKDKKLVKKRLEIFLSDPFSTTLKTHKLSGKLDGYFSFSITCHYRVLFRFEDKETVEFIDIGTHDIYK